uniref:Uncharacterized protein n=1 Tax=Caenorhabditis japonica TaxID=281687 RepID=A0A8R1E2P3_CAEJA
MKIDRDTIHIAFTCRGDIVEPDATMQAVADYQAKHGLCDDDGHFMMDVEFVDLDELADKVVSEQKQEDMVEEDADWEVIADVVEDLVLRVSGIQKLHMLINGEDVVMEVPNELTSVIKDIRSGMHYATQDRLKEVQVGSEDEEDDDDEPMAELVAENQELPIEDDDDDDEMPDLRGESQYVEPTEEEVRQWAENRKWAEEFTSGAVSSVGRDSESSENSEAPRLNVAVESSVPSVVEKEASKPSTLDKPGPPPVSAVEPQGKKDPSHRIESPGPSREPPKTRKRGPRAPKATSVTTFHDLTPANSQPRFETTFSKETKVRVLASELKRPVDQVAKMSTEQIDKCFNQLAANHFAKHQQQLQLQHGPHMMFPSGPPWMYPAHFGPHKMPNFMQPSHPKKVQEKTSPEQKASKDSQRKHSSQNEDKKTLIPHHPLGKPIRLPPGDPEGFLNRLVPVNFMGGGSPMVPPMMFPPGFNPYLMPIMHQKDPAMFEAMQQRFNKQSSTAQPGPSSSAPATVPSAFCFEPFGKKGDRTRFLSVASPSWPKDRQCTWRYGPSKRDKPIDVCNTISAIYEFIQLCQFHDADPSRFLDYYYLADKQPKLGDKMSVIEFNFHATRRRCDELGVKIPMLDQRKQFDLYMLKISRDETDNAKFVQLYNLMEWPLPPNGKFPKMRKTAPTADQEKSKEKTSEEVIQKILSGEIALDKLVDKRSQKKITHPMRPEEADILARAIATVAEDTKEENGSEQRLAQNKNSKSKAAKRPTTISNLGDLISLKKRRSDTLGTLMLAQSVSLTGKRPHQESDKAEVAAKRKSPVPSKIEIGEPVPEEPIKKEVEEPVLIAAGSSTSSSSEPSQDEQKASKLSEVPESLETEDMPILEQASLSSTPQNKETTKTKTATPTPTPTPSENIESPPKLQKEPIPSSSTSTEPEKQDEPGILELNTVLNSNEQSSAEPQTTAEAQLLAQITDEIRDYPKQESIKNRTSPETSPEDDAPCQLRIDISDDETGDVEDQKPSTTAPPAPEEHHDTSCSPSPPPNAEFLQSLAPAIRRSVSASPSGFFEEENSQTSSEGTSTSFNVTDVKVASEEAQKDDETDPTTSSEAPITDTVNISPADSVIS